MMLAAVVSGGAALAQTYDDPRTRDYLAEQRQEMRSLTRERQLRNQLRMDERTQRTLRRQDQLRYGTPPYTGGSLYGPNRLR